MELKLAVADYSFPLLEWEQSLRLAHEIGTGGVDIGLFHAGSHLRPDLILENPEAGAASVSATSRAHGLQPADVFGIPGAGFDQDAPNAPNPSSRQKSSEYFHRILRFAVRCAAPHLTLLPGVHFPQEQKEDSLELAPTLILTLDPSHFVRQGISDDLQLKKCVVNDGCIAAILALGYHYTCANVIFLT